MAKISHWDEVRAGDSHWHWFFRTEHQLFINKTIFLNHSEQNILNIHPRGLFLPSLVTSRKTVDRFYILKTWGIRKETRASMARWSGAAEMYGDHKRTTLGTLGR